MVVPEREIDSLSLFLFLIHTNTRSLCKYVQDTKILKQSDMKNALQVTLDFRCRVSGEEQDASWNKTHVHGKLDSLKFKEYTGDLKGWLVYYSEVIPHMS